ncbi:glycosyltransferase family 2 protein [Mesorhizobium sp. M0913]|uniref:glycosyltransferase family 2 protein n=1 Tax=Mesorhizobium sp. M0913 TaxID=2957026 RepID=UPI00333596C1
MKDSSIPITVVVPVKNEELSIAACLSRLTRFKQVIVVDSHSSDRTCEIAVYYGAEVIQFDWNGRFPKKRNWLLLNKKLQSEWVLFLDADELVSDQFCDAAEIAVRSKDCQGYWLRYDTHFLGRRLRHGVPQRKLALFRVGFLYEEVEENAWSSLDMEVHEHPIIVGPVGEIAEKVDHNDDRGLAKFIDRHRQYASWEAERTMQVLGVYEDRKNKLSPRQRAKYRFILRWWFSPAYLVYDLIIRLGVLDGTAGVYRALYKSWYFMTIRLLVLERQRERG